METYSQRVGSGWRVEVPHNIHAKNTAPEKPVVVHEVLLPVAQKMLFDALAIVGGIERIARCAKHLVISGSPVHSALRLNRKGISR